LPLSVYAGPADQDFIPDLMGDASAVAPFNLAHARTTNLFRVAVICYLLGFLRQRLAAHPDKSG
jgi:hypothetical protein